MWWASRGGERDGVREIEVVGVMGCVKRSCRSDVMGESEMGCETQNLMGWVAGHEICDMETETVMKRREIVMGWVWVRWRLRE